MTDRALQIIIAGISIKLQRGEILDGILAAYTKLTDDEKTYIVGLLGGTNG